MRQRSKEERALIHARIVELAKKEPELTRRQVATRFGCSVGFVLEVQRSAGVYVEREAHGHRKVRRGS